MKKSLRNPKSLLSLLVVLLAALGLFASGCEEKKADTEEKEAEPAAEGTEEPAAEGTEAPAAEGTAKEGGHMEGMEGMEGMADDSEATDVTLVHQPGAQVGDHTMCPVMGGEFEVTADSPSVEHEGKKVFFCCAGCDAKFQEDPAGKLAELKTKIDAANAE